MVEKKEEHRKMTWKWPKKNRRKEMGRKKQEMNNIWRGKLVLWDKEEAFLWMIKQEIGVLYMSFKVPPVFHAVKTQNMKS